MKTLTTGDRTGKSPRSGQRRVLPMCPDAERQAATHNPSATGRDAGGQAVYQQEEASQREGQIEWATTRVPEPDDSRGASTLTL